ncbi:single-stranded DNA-binding protein [Xanthomonas sp. NCPPB 2632]|uniref:single-stranded DNA-binding protein n=1 Tax=Xanthomonas sp. NCPPB 2632 TaxID=3240912 RepID=UPI0035149FF9
MSLQIQIENENVKVREGMSKQNKPYKMREQDCVVYGIGRFPIQMKLTLPDGIEGYKVGLYDVTTPLNAGRYGLEAARDLGLVPAAKKAVQAA